MGSRWYLQCRPLLVEAPVITKFMLLRVKDVLIISEKFFDLENRSPG
jgi:hypothetical protein